VISANTGLYGNIIRETLNLFVKHVKETKSDIVIIGRLGRQLYDNMPDSLPYEYFDLSDGVLVPEDLTDLVKHIVSYESVTVFHGKFESVLAQHPIQTYITGDTPHSKVQPKQSDYYIFEPSLNDLIRFFESEINKN